MSWQLPEQGACTLTAGASTDTDGASTDGAFASGAYADGDTMMSPHG